MIPFDAFIYLLTLTLIQLQHTCTSTSTLHNMYTVMYLYNNVYILREVF